MSFYQTGIIGSRDIIKWLDILASVASLTTIHHHDYTITNPLDRQSGSLESFWAHRLLLALSGPPDV